MMYDLLVIGNEREGLERALSAARAGYRVAVGGLQTTPPSIALMQQAVDRVSTTSSVTMAAIRAEVAEMARQEASADLVKMNRAGIERIAGDVRFLSETVVEFHEGESRRQVSAAKIVIACGVRSRQPVSFHIDGEQVLTPESLLDLETIPESMIIVGGGATGLAAAILMAKLGVEITVVDEQANLFAICRGLDGSFDEVTSLSIAFRLGEEAIGTLSRAKGQNSVKLASGRELTADLVLICVGQEGQTDNLYLEQAGVGVDEHGRVWCDMEGRTWTSGIFAVGSVVSTNSQRTTTTVANGDLAMLLS